jgi:uncharacterized protein (TIGR00369 family)
MPAVRPDETGYPLAAMANVAAPIHPAIWTEPVRGGYPDPTLFGLSGLEQMRAFFRNLAAPPPIHHLTGMIPTEAQPGAATFTMPATGWLLCPPGYVQLGTQAILADGPLGSAIQTSLPPFTAYTTAELSINHARPVDASSGTLVARGRLIFAGRSLGLSETVIEDARGRVVAHSTSRCVIFPPMGPPPAELPDYPRVPAAVYDSPDPYLRPEVGEVLGQDIWDRMTGLEVMQGLIDGGLPAPPITHLTGLRAVEVAEGVSTFVLPASGWLCSPLGRVEGGAIALLADTVIGTSVQTTLPPRTVFLTLDLKVNFLRPVKGDGRDLIGRGTVTHRGRTIAVAGAELTDADGKRVALATGTVLIVPDRPWRLEDLPAEADGSAE